LGLVLSNTIFYSVITKSTGVEGGNDGCRHSHIYEAIFVKQDSLEKFEIDMRSFVYASSTKLNLKEGYVKLYSESEFKRIEPALKEILKREGIINLPLVRTTPELEAIIKRDT
jgi:hypothetical protein